MIAAPVASAANTWITSVLIESTSETADIATLPTLLTIMVSAIPIREFNICSTMIGISSIHNSFVENMRLSQSIFVASYSLFFIFLSFLSKITCTDTQKDQLPEDNWSFLFFRVKCCVKSLFPNPGSLDFPKLIRKRMA